MALPTFDGFSLQDDNYITEEIIYRTIPARSVEMEQITRRPGTKILGSEFGARKVLLKGHIIADSATDLQSKIDAIHSNITRKEEGVLTIESGRTGTALVSSVGIMDPHYAQDYVPFEIEMVMPDPFFYGSQQTVSVTVTSGVSSVSFNTVISGSAYAEPTIVYTAPGTSGYTTTSGISIEYTPTAEILTWSGTSTNTLAYNSSVTFNYADYSILEGLNEVDIEGVFARWEPITTSFIVTFSGTAQGGSIDFSYQPRYL